MKPIFEYMNYREFLRDFYTEKKRKTPYFSYRLFSEKAGFKAPNLLKLVMDGKRNLTKESVFKFSKALKLKRSEDEYFENLVFFNQSKTLEEKNAYLQRLMKYRRREDVRTIESAEFEYYSAWYHPVVRELATAIDFKNDYRRLGSMVVPSISASEARKSVELLLKLGFVKHNDKGVLVVSEPVLTTKPPVTSVAVANFHRHMLQLASESIERFGPEERNVTGLTLRISEETRKAMVEKLRQVRQELLDMAVADEHADRVVQINMQVFPLTGMFDDRGGDS